MTYDISEILKLSPEEKLRIIGDIHDSIEQERMQMPEWHKQELDRREAAGDDTMKPWSDLRKDFGLT